jgi:hypothetical protein
VRLSIKVAGRSRRRRSAGWLVLGPSRANQDLEQIPHFSPPHEGMPQREVCDDLVVISAPLSLAEHVAVFDELGQDPVGRALRDAHRVSDVPQPDAGIVGNAGEDMSVISQEVPARKPGTPASGTSSIEPGRMGRERRAPQGFENSSGRGSWLRRDSTARAAPRDRASGGP